MVSLVVRAFWQMGLSVEDSDIFFLEKLHQTENKYCSGGFNVYF